MCGCVRACVCVCCLDYHFNSKNHNLPKVSSNLNQASGIYLSPEHDLLSDVFDNIAPENIMKGVSEDMNDT